MHIRRLSAVPAIALLVAAVASPASANRPSDVSWGPVVLVADQGFDSLSSITTDNGLVVAAWTGPDFNNLWVAVRPAGGSWSEPQEIVTTAASLSLTKDGDGAWVLWQGFSNVSAAQIGSDGAVGTPSVIGPSSDPFVSDPVIAAGSNGAVAAAWHTRPGEAPEFVYKPAGQDWTSAATFPHRGSIEGLTVGAKGVPQLLLAHSHPDAQHEEVDYFRRTSEGTWKPPFVVASSAYLTTVSSDQHGDLVVGWQVVNDNGTFTLAARYKAADSGFGAVHHLDESVPADSHVALAMAANGSLVAAYRTSEQGDQQIQMTPADSTGDWLDPQNLQMTGSTYAVAMNARGDAVVTGSSESGLQVVRCPSGGPCGDTDTDPATGLHFPGTSVAPHGTITLVWGRGCHTEECLPSRVVAQRGR